MRSPAAPYFEFLVANEVLAICREHHLSHTIDSFGNILVTYQRGAATRPLILAAHMDHPGFVIRDRLSARRWKSEFLGGVPEEYFKEGTRLRLYPGGLPARLARRLRNKNFEITALSVPEVPPQYAVWDLPDFKLERDRLIGRACDDLVGVATILDVLKCLSAAKASTHVVGVLSRAEEVGFQGALALAQSRVLPKESLLISLETSRELPPVKIGGGVIVRVGDRASVFNSAATRFLGEVASELAKKDARFRHQRALMGGGTCEATAYQEYGYCCAAVCVALGNYHNCGPNNKIRAEYVSLSDAENMSQLLQTAAVRLKNFEGIVKRLPVRLERLARVGIRELKRTKMKISSEPTSKR